MNVDESIRTEVLSRPPVAGSGIARGIRAIAAHVKAMNAPPLTLTTDEYLLFRELLTQAEYTAFSLPNRTSELAKALMQSIEARTDISFERLT